MLELPWPIWTGLQGTIFLSAMYVSIVRRSKWEIVAAFVMELAVMNATMV